MTMPDERYRAVLRTEELLKKIFNGKYLVDGDYEKAYDEIWLEVKRCIRHYPSKFYMDDAQELAPQVFGEPKISMNKSHKEAELIKAWAGGAEIQMLDTVTGKWVDIPNPAWYTDKEYRLKPKVGE